MTPDDWRRAKDILAAAIKRPPSERRGYVVERCGADAQLLEEIESLLESYDDESTLDRFLARRQARDGAEDSSSTRLAAVVPTAPPPTQTDHVSNWGGFTLLEEIGRGGFGVVHRAWDAALKREIALKIVDLRKMPGANEETLLREGQMLARVRHRNVVTVHSVQRIGDEVGLAMEFIRGRTLSNLVSQHGPMSAQETAPIGIAVCDALAAVHNVGLVHRDLKASNVMRESGGRIVLMDFGAGRELRREPGTWSNLLGTPLYMSPHVLQGAAATPASDVFSLGVLLFYLVTGEYPFPGHGFAEVLDAHIQGRRVLLAALRPDLPLPFVDAVDRMIETESSKRCASAVLARRALVEAMPEQQRRDRARRRSAGGHVGAGPSRRASGEPVALAEDRDANVPGPRRMTGIVQLSLLTASSLVVLTGLLGFLTTLEFNAVLGRTSPFTPETLLTYIGWGARTLIAPSIYIGFALLAFSTASLLLRLVLAAAPSLKARVVAARQAFAARLVALGLYDPATFAQALCAFGVVALFVILLSHQPLLSALTSRVDQAPAETFAVLSTDHRNAQSVFRILLNLLLLALTTGFIKVAQVRRRTPTRVVVGHLISIGALIGIVLFFATAGWRITFASKFPAAVYKGLPCFVIGESGNDLLLHCPTASASRNRIAKRDDPSLTTTTAAVDMFDMYPRVPERPSVP